MDALKDLGIKEIQINDLEKMLTDYNKIDNILEEELVKIIEEDDIDEKGKIKKRFSNAEKRTDELKKRCGTQYNEKEQLKIDIEIQRLRIGLLTERIRFYSK